MTKKIEISRSKLEDLYVRQGLSANQIAKKFNCWGTTIAKHLKECGIKLRAPKKALMPDRELLRSLYIRKSLSPYSIAPKFGCTPTTVRRWLGIYKIPIRRKKLIKTPKQKLEYLYNVKRLSLHRIGKLLHCTPAGLLKIFRKLNISTRTTSQASKFHLYRHDFNENPEVKSYMIGFRLGDLHVRRTGELIQVGGGTTKKEQVELFTNLFDKYGKVYIGSTDSRGAWHLYVYLNKSFYFLIPKCRRIPKWILASKKNFMNFFAGYTDAEGNIGCYPRARFKITSYDNGLLRDIARQIRRHFKISPIFFLEKTNRLTHNQDALSLIINTKEHLSVVLKSLRPYLKHDNRKKCLEEAMKNISLRNSRT